MKSLLKQSILCSAVALGFAAPVDLLAATIDDFNVTEGRFSSNPSTSGSSTGVATTSTADRVTTDGPREGVGHEKIVLIYNGTSATFRCRFLSGGGSPANNFSIVTTDGTDGWIGFYLKTTNSGWVTSLNLDGPGNTVAEMDGSTSLDVIADGEWHLYEWNLDDANHWGAVPGIGGGHGGLLNGTHTIDSIWFRQLEATLPTDPTNVNALIYLDFVAINPSGSISNLLTDPCINTPSVVVNGPIATNLSEVTILGVTGTASAVRVYQETSSGPVLVGSKTSGIVEGTNQVAVTGLVKGAKVVATQVVAGQESCQPTTGVFVGGGANPPVRLALSIREETVTAGPIGASGNGTNTSIHFLGASALSGGAPVDAAIVYPSNDWQTVTFYRGPVVNVPDATDLAGTLASGAGYEAFTVVSAQVFAYRNIPETGSKVFSAVGAQSFDMVSDQPYQVNWTWTAVPGADGYRLLRNTNYAGYLEYRDVTANSLLDNNTGWLEGTTVTPTNSFAGRSIKWNASSTDPVAIGTTNTLLVDWGVLEALSFVIAEGDTGPFDLYIDSIRNGTTMFQTFDSAAPGTPEVGFRVPGFSGSTSPGLLSVPNLGVVTDTVADSGANSLRVSWQWNGTNNSRWLRLTTSGVGNPIVNLNEPISFKLLMLPVGSAPPSGPKSISATLSGAQVILDWDGSAYLQASDTITGTFTDITGLVTGPYTNSITPQPRFFRLRN